MESLNAPVEVLNAQRSLYYGRTMLAPMVRICDVGFRALCAAHGAEVVFSEEVVAAKLRQCRREICNYPGIEHPMAEYVTYEPFKHGLKRSVAFSTFARGADSGTSGQTSMCPVILQLGVADGAVGASAAVVAAPDIDGVDVNMGCPKKFSVQNGFGAALMEKPAHAGEILRNIHEAVNSPAERARRGGAMMPISFKTRLKDTVEETVDMLRSIVMAAGMETMTALHAITLHARTRDQRSEEQPLYERAQMVVTHCRKDTVLKDLCYVLNGSVTSQHDGAKKREQYGFDGVMIARAALCDPWCFSPEYNTMDLNAAHYLSSMKEVLLYSIRFRGEFKNLKYHFTRSFPAVPALSPHMPSVQQRMKAFDSALDFFGVSGDERVAADLSLDTHKICILPPDASPVMREDCGSTALKRPRSVS